MNVCQWLFMGATGATLLTGNGVVSFRMPPRRTLRRWSPATSPVIAVVLAFGAVVAAQTQQAAPALMRPADIGKLPMPPADHTLPYGQDTNQIGELRLPAGPGPHAIIVVVHGGCWMPQAARYLAAMGDELKKDGIASWNIEYRRIGQPGGGWPGTYLDVGHAIDHLRDLAAPYKLDLDRVVVLGHSAGDTWPYGPERDDASTRRVPCSSRDRCPFAA